MFRAVSERVALHVLVVDDDADVRFLLADSLREAGHSVSEAPDGSKAVELLGSSVFDVVLCDMRMPGVDGLAVLRQARIECPRTHVILMTAYGVVADAVLALKEGASDYLVKPFHTDEITVRIERIASNLGLRRELAQAQEQLADRTHPFIGRSPSILRLLDKVETLAQSEAPVFISGESGTGKELVARTLHAKSTRASGPFVAVNCAAFPETLLEAELFGHSRGAFTGAVKSRQGRFAAASGGTLLLDEVAEIPLAAQAKLLRVLQEGRVEPLGTNESVPVDIRILSATHRNLKERLVQGRFREDLYYRLHVLSVHIPPLRDRRCDLPLLVQYFLCRCTPPGRPLPTISPRAWAVLSQHPFPGNVRELAHAVEHAVVMARGEEIDLEHLPPDLAGGRPAGSRSTSQLQPLSRAVREFEREYLLRALDAAGGIRVRAAELLGISRKCLWEKLRLHGIEETEA